MSQPGQFILQDRPYYKPKKNVVLRNKPHFNCSIIFAIIGGVLVIGGIVSIILLRDLLIMGIAFIMFGLFIGLLFQCFACRFTVIYTMELDFENDKFILDVGGNCCATMCSNIRRHDELPLEDIYGLYLAGWKTMTTPKIRSDAYDANGEYHPIPDLAEKPEYLVRVVTRMGLSYSPNYYHPLNKVQEIFDAWNEYQGWAIQNGKRPAVSAPPQGFDAAGQQIYPPRAGQMQQQPYPQQGYPQQQQYPQQQYPQQQYTPQQYNQQAYAQPPGQPGQYQPEYNAQNAAYQPPNTLPSEGSHSFPAEVAADPGIVDEKKVA
ncbi:hypothetical protein BLNAU_8007 [Blattamonas nauphoetae]|uniref:Uncharacterized protein n=1 Tax=Blattamonas nauphoetae TaxID=2049346 RepID=A0ABQ9XZK3_9EUKA|nr:hypothetical protein BLNAU_8007 [Blattamonas nauphoetae]